MPSQRADDLVRCPVGCAFLLTIERDRVPVALAVTPGQAFARLAKALSEINPWMDGFDRNVAEVLGRGPSLVDLAREVVEHPATSWWTAPMDRGRQVLLIEEREEPSSPPSISWESYAQRPGERRVTSTLRGGYSCLDAQIESGTGDWPPGPWRRFEANINDTARVFEVQGPADWHTLCASHPYVNDHRNSPAGVGTLSPDWRSVATQWDGVHLTLMAILTAPFVRYQDAAGTSMLWSWDTECTIWLPGESLLTGAALPPWNVEEMPDVTPLMLGGGRHFEYDPSHGKEGAWLDRLARRIAEFRFWR